MAGVHVQDIELVQQQDRAMLSSAVSSFEERMSQFVTGLPAIHQVPHQSVYMIIGPIPWGHSGPSVTRCRRRRRCGHRCAGGVRQYSGYTR